MNTLVIADVREGTLRPSSLEAVSAAAAVSRASSGHLAVAVIDRSPDSVLGQLAVEGVDEVLLVPSGTEHFDPVRWRELVGSLQGEAGAELIVTPMSVNSLGFAPALAAERGWGLATDATSMSWDEELSITRPEYSGKIEVSLGFPDKDVVVVTLREGIFAPSEPVSAVPQSRTVDIHAGATGIEHLTFEQPPAESGVDITSAALLLAVGRGLEDEEDLADFEQLAEAMGGTLAVSRPLVDAGWAAGARQVGQSGKTVRPKVYLAMGISGAVQHLAGMRDAETIIAVNTDPEAPIFRVADYGVVADMFDVVEELSSHFGA